MNDFTYRCPRFLNESLRACTGAERFLTVIGCGIVTTGLLIGGFIDQAVYNSLTMATIGVFIAGSAVEVFAGKKTDQ